MAGVEFQDFRIDVKKAMKETAVKFLIEASAEIEAHAKRNCKMEDDTGKQLKGSYKSTVNEGNLSASIGSGMEAVYWEEFGTGEYAVKKDGRKGWWVYVKDGQRGTGGKSYDSKAEAEAVAASMRADGLDAYATNGRRPSHTLQNAFTQNKAKILARAKQIFGEGMK